MSAVRLSLNMRTTQKQIFPHCSSTNLYTFYASQNKGGKEKKKKKRERERKKKKGNKQEIMRVPFTFSTPGTQ